MALKPLSVDSKVVVYNPDTQLIDKTSKANHQGVAVSEILALGGEGDYLPLTGGIVTGATTFTGGALTVNSAEFKIEAFLPSIFLTDLNDDSDFAIRNNNGLFEIRDMSAPKVPFSIASDGTINMDASTGQGTTIYGGLEVGGGPLEVPFQGMIVNNSSALGIGIRFENNTGHAYNAVNFETSVGHAGNILVENLSTSYNTSSDYRLKENVIEITDAADRVKALKPVKFNFIGQSKVVDGFLAHEAQAVVPESVNGTKDAVDEEGNPVYQGIDQSKLVPLLTAALKDAIARIEALEAQAGI